jgi:uncharacterized membrane protein
VEKKARALAVVAYLVPLIGPLLVLLVGRKNLFAFYHACQALVVFVGAFLLSLIWGAFAWAISWIPLAGIIAGVSTFALVMATWLIAIISFVLGIRNSAQGSYRRVPIFGIYGERLFLRFNADEELVALQDRQEAVV